MRTQVDGRVLGGNIDFFPSHIHFLFRQSVFKCKYRRGKGSQCVIWSFSCEVFLECLTCESIHFTWMYKFYWYWRRYFTKCNEQTKVINFAKMPSHQRLWYVLWNSFLIFTFPFFTFLPNRYLPNIPPTPKPIKDWFRKEKRTRNETLNGKGMDEKNCLPFSTSSITFNPCCFCSSKTPIKSSRYYDGLTLKITTIYGCDLRKIYS